MKRTILALACAAAALTAGVGLAQPRPRDANVPAATNASDSSIIAGIGAPNPDNPDFPSNGGGVIPDSVRRSYASANTPSAGPVAATVAGAVTMDLSATAAPISSVQRELNRLGLSGTPNRGGATAPAGEALTPSGPVQAARP